MPQPALPSRSRVCWSHCLTLQQDPGTKANYARLANLGCKGSDRTAAIKEHNISTQCQNADAQAKVVSLALLKPVCCLAKSIVVADCGQLPVLKPAPNFHWRRYTNNSQLYSQSWVVQDGYTDKILCASKSTRCTRSIRPSRTPSRQRCVRQCANQSR